MTKKHFIALADMIKKHNTSGMAGGRPFYSDHINALCDFCEEQNPMFNRERFKGYINGDCGRNGGKVKQTVNA